MQGTKLKDEGGKKDAFKEKKRKERENVRGFPRIADPHVGDSLCRQVTVVVDHVLGEIALFRFIFILEAEKVLVDKFLSEGMLKFSLLLKPHCCKKMKSPSKNTYMQHKNKEPRLCSLLPLLSQPLSRRLHILT